MHSQQTSYCSNNNALTNGHSALMLLTVFNYLLLNLNLVYLWNTDMVALILICAVLVIDNVYRLQGWYDRLNDHLAAFYNAKCCGIELQLRQHFEVTTQCFLCLSVLSVRFMYICTIILH